MNKRQTIVAKFSTFFQLYPMGWVKQPELERNMNRLLQQYPNRDEKFWFKYWLDAALNDTDPLAVEHLRAYLDEPCYTSAFKTQQRFSTPEFLLSDYFQIARLQPLQLYKSYDPAQSNPHYFAQMKLKDAILSVVRQGKEAQRRSDYGLLHSISKKALQNAALLKE